MSDGASFVGRRKPYTQIGIRRRRCQRCRRQARYQWSACANGNRYVPLCELCDVELNRLALAFMRVPGASKLLKSYALERIK